MFQLWPCDLRIFGNRMPKTPIIAQNCLYCPELPLLPRIAQNAQNCPECPELPKTPRIAQNCPKCPELPRIAQNCPELPRIAQNAQNCPKLPKMPGMAQNGPEFPKMSRIAQISVQIYTAEKFWKKLFSGTPCRLHWKFLKFWQQCLFHKKISQDEKQMLHIWDFFIIIYIRNIYISTDMSFKKGKFKVFHEAMLHQEI